MSTDSLLFGEADLARPALVSPAEILVAQEQFSLDFTRLDGIDPTPKRYHEGTHTFKIHSWAFSYYDVAEAMNNSVGGLSIIIKPGITTTP